MYTDDEKVHLLSARQWLTRADQEQDNQPLRPAVAMAFGVITNLLRIINRQSLQVELLEAPRVSSECSDARCVGGVIPIMSVSGVGSFERCTLCERGHPEE